MSVSSVEPVAKQTQFISNRLYDRIKWVAQILLPALGTLYFALAKTWGFPYPEETLGSLAAFDTFLGALLMVASGNYVKSEASTDGSMLITKTLEGTSLYSLELNTQPDNLVNLDKVTFKVVK